VLPQEASYRGGRVMGWLRNQLVRLLMKDATRPVRLTDGTYVVRMSGEFYSWVYQTGYHAWQDQKRKAATQPARSE
jgi:hypothetical protein